MQRNKLIYDSLQTVGDVDFIVASSHRMMMKLHDGQLCIDTTPGQGHCRAILGWDEDYLQPNIQHLDPLENLKKWVEQNIVPSNYDLLVARYLEPISKLGGINCIPNQILDFDDADHLRINLIKEDKSGSEVFENLENNSQSAEYILNKLSPFHHVWFTSENDRGKTPNVNGSVLNNIPFVNGAPRVSSKIRQSKMILIVGVFTHHPNLWGVEHYVNRIWPSVLESVPDAQLHLVGSIASDDKSRLHKNAGVHVHGFVEDLSKMYEMAQFSIAPIYFGAGTNIKVVEAYHYKRPCLVTPFSHYGFENHFIDGVSTLVSINDQEYISNTVNLLKNIDLCSKLANHGIEIVLNFYSKENFTKHIVSTINSMA